MAVQQAKIAKVTPASNFNRIAEDLAPIKLKVKRRKMLKLIPNTPNTFYTLEQ